MIPVLVALGGVSAHLAARRHPRDELRIESETRTPRPTSPAPTSSRLLRVDRASVWRVVPMRRGIMVLAIGPGLVGVAGGLDWPQLTILPGLVASGGALLFGVNAWCLEARGVLWRESLPVDPATVFDARVVVLMEFLLLSSGFTILLASLRAGVPSPQELAAILSTWLVVTMQVVSASMRWSAKRPFAVDLRSARATPAPPAVMVGYSSRLAVSTTLTSLIFSGPGPAPRVAAGRPDRHPVPRGVHRPGARCRGRSGWTRPSGCGSSPPSPADARRPPCNALSTGLPRRRTAPRHVDSALQATPPRRADRGRAEQGEAGRDEDRGVPAVDQRGRPGPAPACVATVTNRVIPQAAPR